MKRKAAEEETEVKQQKKPKIIKLDKLEGWGENRDNENEEDENLPEGWWRTMDKNNNDRVVKNDTQPTKSKKVEGDRFKFKKNGKLNKAEVQELKRTCNSILDWVKVPAIPPPLSPCTVK